MILNLHKPVGWTSFDVCKKIKSITKEKKVGHGGTLDPFAEGVLIIGTGADTKKLNQFNNEIKSYNGSIRLGHLTDTLDTEGKLILKQDIPKISKNLINDIFKFFIGTYYQIPPMYSAKKVNGKKLYDYARNNITIKRKAVRLKIHSLSLISFDEEHIYFSVVCSKGTYIRVLGSEIAEKLGTIGYLDSLLRTSVGNFTINQSQSIENFESSWKSSIQQKN